MESVFPSSIGSELHAVRPAKNSDRHINILFSHDAYIVFLCRMEPLGFSCVYKLTTDQIMDNGDSHGENE